MAMTTADLEQAIATCVREFYDKARQDPMLGPVFAHMIRDWDAHLTIVQNFWSRALLGTERYQGSPFTVHAHLPIEPEHFTRWLTLFEETAKATLPPDLAEKASAKANHMAVSFKAGIFPFVDAEGRPSRHPA
jgi:hemoglobin